MNKFEHFDISELQILHDGIKHEINFFGYDDQLLMVAESLLAECQDEIKKRQET